MDNIGKEILINSRGALNLILITVIFPDITEIKAYHNCKKKVERIAELLAIRKYAKNKNVALKEIFNIKKTSEIKEFVDKIYEKFIFQEDIMNLLNK